MTDVVALESRLEVLAVETDARLNRAEAAIEEFDLVLASGTAIAPVTRHPGLLYPSLDAWVAGHFVRVYIRRHGGPLRWCRQWWQHAEAVTRLEALWRCWEALRMEPLGLETWLRERLDHHLPHLMSAVGPFAACTPDKHTDNVALPVDPAPPTWWANAPDAQRPDLPGGVVS